MRDRNAALSAQDVPALAWDKMDGLLPAIVQDRRSGRVLMVGYVTQEALAATLETGLATFWSRSRQRLWTKGETSGNHLRVAQLFVDCDGDAILMLADPEGPTCHLGTQSCFGEAEPEGPAWLQELSGVVAGRAAGRDPSSYTVRLLTEGTKRVAQKVGEEGVEVALAAVAGTNEELAGEMADLLYHLVVLMEARSVTWQDVVAILKCRHKA